MALWNRETNTLVGLDIGAHSIKAAEIKKKKSGIELSKFGYLCLPRGTVLEGQILDAPVLEDAIKELFSKEKFHSKEIGLALSGSYIMTKRISIPALSETELLHELPIIANQYLGVSADEYALDYQWISQRNPHTIILIAARKKLVESYRSLLESCDLKPSSFETTGSALTTLHTFLFPQSSPTLIIHSGASLTHCIGIENHITVSQLDIPMGGIEITENLRNKKGLSYEEAETLKINLGTGKNLAENSMAAVNESCEKIGVEIEKHLISFSKQFIKNIWLSGGSALLPPLLQNIFNKVKVETHLLRPFRILQMGTVDTTIGSQFTETVSPIAIGLAMRGLKN